MMKKITAQRLQNNLWRTGPYIVYYNVKNDFKNQMVIQNIKEVSKKYFSIDVFEVDWEDYKRYEENVKYELMKTVSIYFKQKLEIQIAYPNMDQIQQIFAQSQQMFVQKCQENTKYLLEKQNNGKLIAPKKNISRHKSLNEEQKRRKNERSQISRRGKKAKNIIDELKKCEKSKLFYSNKFITLPTNTAMGNTSSCSLTKEYSTIKEKMKLPVTGKHIELKNLNKSNVFDISNTDFHISLQNNVNFNSTYTLKNSTKSDLIYFNEKNIELFKKRNNIHFLSSLT